MRLGASGRASDGPTHFNGPTDVAVAANGVFDTLTQGEYDRWQRATEGVNKEWITDVSAKGANGAALLDDAKALIRKNGG